MIKPYIFLMLCISLCLWMGFSACAPMKTNQNELPVEEPIPGHPALDIQKKYMVENPQQNLIIPYHVNLMALDMLRAPTVANLRMVKRYMEWYLDHLNYPDLYGITGSIYDYQVFADGSELSLNEMDSVDSYAASFIMLVDKYSDVANDISFPQLYHQKLEDIIYLIPYLLQPDGLTVALPNTTGKYLMDNCEALAGVAAFVRLAQRCGWDSLEYYKKLHINLLVAIETLFYNPNQRNYYWLIDGKNVPVSSWHVFYPDAYAQLFPIVFGVIPDPAKRIALWNRFNDYHVERIADIPVEQRIIYEWTKEVIE